MLRVLCCGNPDRGDDGAGPAVARHLAGLGIDAEVLEPFDLIDAWDGSAGVIVVDAVVTGAAPGTVHELDWGEGRPAPPAAFSTHGFGLGEVFELARVLGRLPARIRMYGIEAGGFDLGAGLSGEVARATEAVARRIAAVIT